MKKRQPIRIKQQIFRIITVPLLGIVLLVSLLLTRVYRQVITQELIAVRQQAVGQVAEVFNTKMAQIYSIVTLISEDEELAAYFQKDNGDSELEGYYQASRFKSLADRYILYLGNPYIDFHVLLLNHRGDSFSSLGYSEFDYSVYRNTDWYQESLGANGRIISGHAFQDTVNQEVYDRRLQSSLVLPFYRSVPNLYTNASRGVVVVSVPHRVFLESYDFLGADFSELYVIDRGGGVVSAQRETLLGTNILHLGPVANLVQQGEVGHFTQDGNLYVYAPVNNSRWMLVEEVDLTGYLHPVQTIQQILIVVLMLTALLGILLSNAIAQKLSSPIEQLSLRMSRLGDGCFGTDESDYGIGELLSLRDHFNSMQQSLLRSLERVREEEQSKRRLELSVLQAQINPHFLYNTLYSIRCTAALHNDSGVSGMLDSLIRLLRNSVGSIEHNHTVGEEINYLKDYLELRSQGLSFPISVEWDAEEALLQEPIPRMLLQPLVENAVNHGLQPAGRTGILFFSVGSEEDNLIFTIADNGVGMNAQRLKEVLSGSQDLSRSVNRVGISNVNQRLVHYYGEEYALQIESEEGKGTTITMYIPTERRLKP